VHRPSPRGSASRAATVRSSSQGSSPLADRSWRSASRRLAARKSSRPSVSGTAITSQDGSSMSLGTRTMARERRASPGARPRAGRQRSGGTLRDRLLDRSSNPSSSRRLRPVRIDLECRRSHTPHSRRCARWPGVRARCSSPNPSRTPPPRPPHPGGRAPDRRPRRGAFTSTSSRGVSRRRSACRGR